MLATGVQYYTAYLPGACLCLPFWLLSILNITLDTVIQMGLSEKIQMLFFFSNLSNYSTCTTVFPCYECLPFKFFKFFGFYAK
jgi:hypothetical protein